MLICWQLVQAGAVRVGVDGVEPVNGSEAAESNLDRALEQNRGGDP